MPSTMLPHCLTEHKPPAGTIAVDCPSVPVCPRRFWADVSFAYALTYRRLRGKRDKLLPNLPTLPICPTLLESKFIRLGNRLPPRFGVWILPPNVMQIRLYPSALPFALRTPYRHIRSGGDPTGRPSQRPREQRLDLGKVVQRRFEVDQR